ncbi:hypothetical protein F2P56_006207, partial [Juglans regia]
SSNVAHLENSMSKWLIRMCIHHSSTWPLHVCSISRCLIQSHGRKRAHSRARWGPVAERPLHLTQLRKTSIVLHKWVLYLLHIERHQVIILIGWKVPNIPAADVLTGETVTRVLESLNQEGVHH